MAIAGTSASEAFDRFWAEEVSVSLTGFQRCPFFQVGEASFGWNWIVDGPPRAYDSQWQF